jgi:hypothetical protein
MPVVVSSLDGGEINGGQPIILPNGNFLFTFRAHAPGLYRLMVILANGEQHQLQFYAIDPKHPRT